ncbi:hypothetical protein ES703_99753 [subsurface metagenome]
MVEHQAGPEDFELDEAHKPLVGKTLEQVIAEGESDWEKEQAQELMNKAEIIVREAKEIVVQDKDSLTAAVEF